MPTVFAEEVAQRVRVRLTLQRRTQSDLAGRLGLSQAGVSRRLAGQVEFTVSELATVAAFLDVPMAELLPEAVA